MVNKKIIQGMLSIFYILSEKNWLFLAGEGLTVDPTPLALSDRGYVP